MAGGKSGQRDLGFSSRHTVAGVTVTENPCICWEAFTTVRVEMHWLPPHRGPENVSEPAELCPRPCTAQPPGCTISCPQVSSPPGTQLARSLEGPQMLLQAHSLPLDVLPYKQGRPLLTSPEFRDMLVLSVLSQNSSQAMKSWWEPV